MFFWGDFSQRALGVRLRNGMRLAGVLTLFLGVGQQSGLAQIPPTVASEIVSGAVAAGGNEAEIRACLSRGASARDPDASAGGGIMPAGMSSFLSVLRGESGEGTDRTSNGGIIAYMRNSIDSEDTYFVSAFRFFRELRDLDAAHGRRAEGRHVAIGESPPVDLYSVALRHAHGNRYLALKILSLYGHDDMNQSLCPRAERPTDPPPACSSCRGRLMDLLRPVSSSHLYLPGALRGLGYPADMVAGGESVARACSALPSSEPSTPLCNDRSASYRADYYHVIASAFLGCRIQIAEHSANAGIMDRALSSFTRGLTSRSAARTYKFQRFLEEVASFGANTPYYTAQLTAYLAGVLTTIIASGDDIFNDSMSLDEMVDRVSGSTRFLIREVDRNAARAILRRYLFEIRFRGRQHMMGQDFGRRQCEGQTSFDVCPR